jgi:TonB family protein
MAKRVLLIDYEPRSVERLQGLLSPEYQVSVARDGEEGLAAFSSQPHYEAILLGGMLPRLASGEVIREIRRKGGATAPPILLMVTGYKGSNPKADAQKVGAFDLLVKPFTDDALRSAVRSAIDATDIGAKTVRIPMASAPSGPELTASDIFADVLKDVAGDAPAKTAKPPAPVAPAPKPPVTPPPAPAKAPTPPVGDVEQRLRETLSGMLGGRPTEKTPAPPPKKYAGDADIDRMISDTLSGLPTPPRPRPAADRTPLPPLPAAKPPAAPPPAPAASKPAPPPPAAAPRPAPAPPAPAVPSAPAAPAAAEGSAVSDHYGQYEILERIASGGMAELYRARRSGVEGFQKIVAIKKILPHLADNEGFITMFADEAKLAAQLNHPNIVHIYDLGKIEGGGYFIAMEHVEGRDLRGILDSAHELGTPLPVPLAVYIASKVASALDYAHRRRDADGRDLHIVHRDVSPQNILISYEGDIKLCDFGIAKAASKVSQTESGALKGKIQYMSPEQAWGKPIDRRSDLFSLGSVLYELLTEQKLFHGDSDLTVLENVRKASSEPPSAVNPDVPKALDAVVLRALAKEPEDRYANASDLLRDLEQVLYSYSPAPGSADLAIFLHRLQAEESAVAEAKAREAARAVPEAEVEQKPRRAKAAPVARRTGSVSKAPAPEPATPAPAPAAAAAPPRQGTAPGVFGSYASRPTESEAKSRTVLIATIAVAVLALGAGIFWLTTRKSAPPVASRPTPAPATPIPAPAVVPTAAPTIDAKKVEEEVQRQMAQKKREMQKALAAEKKQADTAAAPAPAPSRGETVPSPVPTAEPVVPTAAPAAAVAPTEEPTEPPAPPTAVPAPPRAAPAVAESNEVHRGDLVGPGPGVVEPELLGKPKITYPPIAKQAGIGAGRVVVLVLVDEDGHVSEARLQQGVAPKSGVNEAVVDAVQKTKFRPATKNGVPVKMWRPVVVDVKP